MQENQGPDLTITGNVAMLKRIFQTSSDIFRTRSPDRDRVTDERQVTSVTTAIDTAMQSLIYEHAGLKRRMDEVIAIASIVGGNEIEDLQTQSDPRAELLQKSDGDIRYGEERLRTLESHIANLRSVRHDLERRFPQITMIPAPR
jgi:hypothetical protein